MKQRRNPWGPATMLIAAKPGQPRFVNLHQPLPSARVSREAGVAVIDFSAPRAGKSKLEADLLLNSGKGR